jgi:hypothetical protein
MKYLDQAIALVLVTTAGAVVLATVLPVLIEAVVVISGCVVLVRGVSYWVDRR